MMGNQALAVDIPVSDFSEYLDTQSNIQEDTNLLLDTKKHKITPGSELTVYSYKHFGLMGADNENRATISASESSKDALFTITQATGTSEVSNINFVGYDENGEPLSSGPALLFHSIRDENSLNTKLSNLRFEGFNNTSSEFALVAGDPSRFSSKTEPLWFEALSISNLEFERNTSKRELLNLKGYEFGVTSVSMKNNTVGSGTLFYVDTASAQVSEITAENNTFSAAALTLKYWDFNCGPDLPSETDGVSTLNDLLFINNTGTGSTSNVLSITGFKDLSIQNALFENNSTKDATIYLSGNDKISLSEIVFRNNESRQGSIHVVTPHEKSGSKTELNLKNIEASGNTVNQDDRFHRYGHVLTVSGEIESTNFESDITINNARSISWLNRTENYNPETDFAIAFNFLQSSSKTNLVFNTEANFYSNLGILAYEGNYTGQGTLNVEKKGTADMRLGGRSLFEVDTVFNIKEGSFSLDKDARLEWEELSNRADPSENSLFAVRSGATFNAVLYDVTNDDVQSQGSKAPLSMSMNKLLFEAGSSFSIQVANPNEALYNEGGSGWLIVAEDAVLDDQGVSLSIADENNWIYNFSDEGLGLSLGMKDESGTVIGGTENNVYVGYAFEGQIRPDESAQSIASATSHFALSTLQTISDGLFFWRPQIEDSLWVRPAYIHDRRDKDDTVGFDANLKGITVGKDFRTDNGYWGLAAGYGQGNLHSLGAIAYTSGDVESAWVAAYGQVKKNDWEFSGILAYLYQDAEQDQKNVAAELHTGTKNDVLQAMASVARTYLVDQSEDSKTYITPLIGLRYTWLRQRDFDVSFAGGGELLEADSESMNVFTIPVQATVRHDWASDEGRRHNIAFTFGGEFNLSDRDMEGDFKDFRNQDAGTWKLVPLDRWQATSKLAYTFYANDTNMTFTLGTEFIYSDNRQLTNAYGVARWFW